MSEHRKKTKTHTAEYESILSIFLCLSSAVIAEDKQEQKREENSKLIRLAFAKKRISYKITTKLEEEKKTTTTTTTTANINM
jgi:hypothetical protein